MNGIDYPPIRTYIGLFNQVNGGLQVQAEVDELPFNTFTLILFLLQHKHVVVKELLKSFVGVVDTQLLEAVDLKDFEASNIQDTNKGGLGRWLIDSGVNTIHQTTKHALVESPRE